MPADPRIHVTFRVSPGGKDWMDDLADENRTTRAAVFRAVLVVARRHLREVTALLKEHP